jgi:hypothetical protein
MDFQFESLGPSLRFVVLAFLLVFGVLLLGLIVFIAILPGKIAKARLHPQAEAIAVCGWVGLPSGILWALALVWAYIRSPSNLTSSSTAGVIADDALAKLANQIDMLERSIVTLEASRRREVPL